MCGCRCVCMRMCLWMDVDVHRRVPVGCMCMCMCLHVYVPQHLFDLALSLLSKAWLLHKDNALFYCILRLFVNSNMWNASSNENPFPFIP